MEKCPRRIQRDIYLKRSVLAALHHAVDRFIILASGVQVVRTWVSYRVITAASHKHIDPLRHIVGAVAQRPSEREAVDSCSFSVTAPPHEAEDEAKARHR